MCSSGVVGCRCLPRTDGPHGLVGQEEAEVTLGQPLERGVKLAHDNPLDEACLALLKRFSNANDGPEPLSERRTNLAAHMVVGLAEDVPPLGVADKGVSSSGLARHGGR